MAEKNFNIENSKIHYRESVARDVIEMAVIRSAEWGDYDYWLVRLTAYYNRELHPQQGLQPRIFYVACEEHKIVGFIAGHLTKRLECEGELQFINVITEYRNKGIAATLIKLLAAWSKKQNALSICVDSGTETARLFYKKQKSENLNQHWMYWKDISIVLQGK